MKCQRTFLLLTFILLLAAVLSASLACSGDDDDDNDAADPTDDDASPDDDDQTDDDQNDDDQTDDDIGDDDTFTDDDTSDDDTSDDDTGDDDIVSDRLMAGAASAPMRFPIGVSIGGFGLREGPRTPYCQLMGGSEGYRDHPNVKALSLLMNDQRIVIAKGSFGWGAESTRTMIVEKVKERTGVDLDRSLILSGTHTHSGPARFFVTPDLVGFIGMDTYDQQITEYIVSSFVDVIVAAMENMVPAKIGFGGREPFDPNYIFANDRRCENGPGDFLENRLWTGLIEDEDGNAISVLVGMAMHGVVYEDTLMTGDAPDGVERGIEALYDYPVTAIYLQGSAGDVTPRRDSPQGHDKEQIVEWIGYGVAQIVREIQNEIVLDDKPDMKIITRRYKHDRETIGYQDGEFGYYNLQGDFVEWEIGALECGLAPSEEHGSIVDCDNPETSLVDGYLGCLVNLAWPVFANQIEYFRQSPLTVAQIGDTYFYTAPGELTSHLAVDIRDEMAASLGVNADHINSLGFAQNHLFYLTQDWDWLQGGFEMEESLFGWRFGRWLTEELGRMAGELDTAYPPVYDDLPPNSYYEEYEPVALENSERLGVVKMQPELENNRFDYVQFAWHGGHPGVDLFTVTLQQKQGNDWVDATRANGTAYDDKGWEMHVRLDPNPRYAGHMPRESRDFLYTIDWETNWDDPAGSLRFKVAGYAKTEKGIEPYEIYSRAFALNEVDSVTLSDLAAEASDDQLAIAVQAAYPPNPDGWRMRSPFAGGSNPAIVSGGTATAVVQVEGYGDTTCELTYDDETNLLVGSFTVAHPGALHTISVDGASFDDGFGNTSATTGLEITITP